ncbi:MAG: hypothetical protein K7J46_21105, partial [Bryobacter sp.]|nr:hypothetical protein [Bryobacter sp. CoA8 C33]
VGQQKYAGSFGHAHRRLAPGGPGRQRRFFIGGQFNLGRNSGIRLLDYKDAPILIVVAIYEALH